MQAYINVCRRRVERLKANRAAITEGGLRMRSNWGGDTTKCWLAELNRQIGEQSAIIAALERGQRP